MERFSPSPDKTLNTYRVEIVAARPEELLKPVPNLTEVPTDNTEHFEAWEKELSAEVAEAEQLFELEAIRPEESLGECFHTLKIRQNRNMLRSWTTV